MRNRNSYRNDFIALYSLTNFHVSIRFLKSGLEVHMLEVGIMVEGQESMTWERFLGLARTVEELGFDSFFRSDHLTALGGAKDRQSLALWPSLSVLASQTRRIRFGPMVCSMTFRHPAILAKMAASVSLLSNGPLDGSGCPECRRMELFLCW
jgi:hypothetical protein